jgi:hypothetical protein
MHDTLGTSTWVRLQAYASLALGALSYLLSLRRTSPAQPKSEVRLRFRVYIYIPPSPLHISFPLPLPPSRSFPPPPSLSLSKPLPLPSISLCLSVTLTLSVFLPQRPGVMSMSLCPRKLQEALDNRPLVSRLTSCLVCSLCCSLAAFASWVCRRGIVAFLTEIHFMMIGMDWPLTSSL